MQTLKSTFVIQNRGSCDARWINNCVRQLSDTGTYRHTSEIKGGTPTVIVLWQRTLKTLASTVPLAVRLLRTTLLLAGCLKCGPTGETSFYPEKSEVIRRLRSRNGWEGTPSVSEMDDNLVKSTIVMRDSLAIWVSHVRQRYAGNRDDSKTCSS